LTRAEGNFDSLGQNERIYHWLRTTPRLSISDDVRVTAQIDVPEGFLLGQETRGVQAADPDYAERQPFGIEPRWLYLEWITEAGTVSIGQQPSHWGLGIWANDGDHPTLFGDYFGGDKVERIMFVTRPGGSATHVHLGAAADVVFEDDRAALTDGDLALQATAMAYYAKRGDFLGFYGQYRHQRSEPEQPRPGEVNESLDLIAIDSAGMFNAKLPGSEGFVFGGYEAIYALGWAERSPAVGSGVERNLDVRQAGAASRVGAVFTKGASDDRWGYLVLGFEWGWASGDDNPLDATVRRLAFDPNYNVGLILFDEVLAWKSARAGTIARTSAAQGVGISPDDIVSNGAVFGATYLNPTIVYRPLRALDLKAGVLVAHATADVVDPTKVAVQNRFSNWDGGPATSRDLGVELDAGIEYRAPLEHGMNLELGVQGGVLFAGNAFDTRTGRSLGTQSLLALRAGFQY
jgi:hypothetical protein